MKRANLASWSITHRQIIYFFMFLCLVAGIYSYNTLGRAEDPSFTVKQMVISAAWPGATAKEMEEQVADKLEKATIQTIEEGVMTGDLAALSTLPNKQTVDTEAFLRAIDERLRKLL